MTNDFKVGKLDQSTNTIEEYDLPTPRTIIRFIYAMRMEISGFQTTITIRLE